MSLLLYHSYMYVLLTDILITIPKPETGSLPRRFHGILQTHSHPIPCEFPTMIMIYIL